MQEGALKVISCILFNIVNNLLQKYEQNCNYINSTLNTKTIRKLTL